MNKSEFVLTKCRVAFFRNKALLADGAKDNPNLMFMAAFVGRLPCYETEAVERAATDGTQILWNPKFIERIPEHEVFFVYAHECCHVMLGHHFRRGKRDPDLFNIAADLTINWELEKSGIPAPSWVYFPGRGSFKSYPGGLSAEQYYELIEKDPPPSGGGCVGRVTEPGTGSQADLAEAEARTASTIAGAEAMARSMGRDSCRFSRLAKEANVRPADWRSILRQFLNCNAYDDFSWSKPNRRYVAQGLYLPGIKSEALGELVIMVDTSGSIGESELGVFTSEIQAVLAAYPCRVVCVFHDYHVTAEQEFESSDLAIKLNAVGGGGTSHVPVFDWLTKRGEEPTCVIALTDLYSSFPKTGPDCPVLWAVIGGNKQQPPFGEVLHLNF